MTDQELDTLIQRVLLDSLKLDWEGKAKPQPPFEAGGSPYAGRSAGMVKKAGKADVEKGCSAGRRGSADPLGWVWQFVGCQSHGESRVAAVGYRMVRNAYHLPIYGGGYDRSNAPI